MQGPVVGVGPNVDQLFCEEVADGVALQVHRWVEQLRDRSNPIKGDRLFQLVTGERRSLSALCSAVRSYVIHIPAKTLPLNSIPNKPNKRPTKYL